MYITTGQAYAYLTAILHRAQTDVQATAPFWQEISDQATTDAFNCIVRGLTARGFGSVSQVPLWDDGPGMQKSIGAFLALEAGGALGAFSDTFILKLDRREELKTIQVTIGGVWANPDGTGGSPLEVGTGSVLSVPIVNTSLQPDRQLTTLDPTSEPPLRW